MRAIFEVFVRFSRLGLTAFGGPIAHLGFFRREFVARAQWLDDEAFTEIVALCTALPGPTSSQVGMLIGTLRAGPLGALAAWLAFTGPSAIVMATLGSYGARLATHSGGHAIGAAASSLSVFALAVVALAVVNLARTLLTTTLARIIAAVAFSVALVALALAPNLLWIALVPGALLGLNLGPRKSLAELPKAFSVSRRTGALCGALAIGVLGLVAIAPRSEYRELFLGTLRAGTLVFGGGHVVLGLLAPLDRDPTRFVPGSFAEGYGLVQSMPGPLFTFAAYLGASDRLVASPVLAATIALCGIFLPSFLLLPAALSLWSIVRSDPRSGAILAGLGASVVGLLAATTLVVFAPLRHLYTQPSAVAAAVASFALLVWARWPAWAALIAVVALAAAVGAIS